MVNEDFVILCKRWNIQHKTSLPYHPQSQGQIDRFNGTIKRTIFKYLTDYNSKRYIDNLHFLVYSYNTSTHNTTKRSPFEIFRKKHEQFKILDNMVLDNLQKNAMKMIENSLKTQQAQEEPLEVGDEVRVGVVFLKAGRKKIGGVNKKSLLKYTKEIYTIVKIEVKEDLELFTLNIDLDGEKTTYYRHQLLKINTQDLVKTKNKNDKDDLNFGENFDTELHISNLAKNTAQKRMLNKPQEERLSAVEINEELERRNAVEKEAEARPKRNRKQRDIGFFVSL